MVTSRKLCKVIHWYMNLQVKTASTHQVVTRSSIATGVYLTVVNVDSTGAGGKSWYTLAGEWVDTIYTPVNASGQCLGLQVLQVSSGTHWYQTHTWRHPDNLEDVWVLPVSPGTQSNNQHTCVDILTILRTLQVIQVWTDTVNTPVMASWQPTGHMGVTGKHTCNDILTI